MRGLRASICWSHEPATVVALLLSVSNPFSAAPTHRMSDRSEMNGLLDAAAEALRHPAPFDLLEVNGKESAPSPSRTVCAASPGCHAARHRPACLRVSTGDQKVDEHLQYEILWALRGLLNLDEEKIS